jgi:FecR protein
VGGSPIIYSTAAITRVSKEPKLAVCVVLTAMRCLGSYLKLIVLDLHTCSIQNLLLIIPRLNCSRIRSRRYTRPCYPASRFVQSHIDREPAPVQHVAMLRRGLALARLAIPPHIMNKTRRDDIKKFSTALMMGLGGLFLGFAVSAQTQSGPVGTATNAIGELVIVRTDGVEFRLQGKGDLPLYEGDVVYTDGGSQAMIEFIEGVTVALNANTNFKLLSRWERDMPTVRIIRLNQGEVWAKTSRGPTRFEVEMPVATAAVEDAEFNLKVQEDGQTILTGIEGVVQFGTAFNTWGVKPSTVSYARRGQKCTKPAPAAAEAARSWTGALRLH